jgi:hypothetical protein
VEVRVFSTAPFKKQARGPGAGRAIMAGHARDGSHSLKPDERKSPVDLSSTKPVNDKSFRLCGTAQINV